MSESVVRHTLRVASRQHGYVTRAQVTAVASSESAADLALARASRRGHLERVARGVYRCVGAPALHEARHRTWAAMLAVDSDRDPDGTIPPTLVAFGATAALWTDPDAPIDPPALVELLAAEPQRTRRTDVRIRGGRLDLADDDWWVHDGLGVTTPQRTVEDVADTVGVAAAMRLTERWLRLRVLQDPAPTSKIVADVTAFLRGDAAATDRLRAGRLGLEQAARSRNGQRPRQTSSAAIV